MKRKWSKNKWVIAFLCIGLLSGVMLAIAASPLDIFQTKYAELDEKDLAEKLSKYSFSEICDEINTLSKHGMDIAQFQFHASALAEKIDHVSSNDLVNLIENKKNSENLRTICVQLLDFGSVTLETEGTSKLKSILLDETENKSVRKNIIWLLPENAASYDLLEIVIFQEDEDIAFQALKRLNRDNPEQAVAIANTLLETQGQDKKLQIAIKVISSQMAESTNVKIKDNWVAYCMQIFNQRSNEKEDLLRENIIFSMSDMYYSKVLYAIITHDDVDNSSKVFCIDQNKKVLADTLNNNPSEHDIEMAIKAMTICPIDETISALQNAVSQSEKSYNLDSVFAKQAEIANENIDY